MLNYFNELKKDFLNKKFMPLKILHFFMIGGMTTLFPFLTIQARSLGITGEELGIIYALLPVLGILGPSLAGLIADKIGNFKLFVSLAVACSGLASLLFIAIPAGRIEHKFPEHLPITVKCSPTSDEIIEPQLPCEFVEDFKELTMNVSGCVLECNGSNPSSRKFSDAVETWCDGNKDCEIVDEITNISKNGTHYEITGNQNRGQDTYYHLNNISVPITLKDNEKPLKITASFCELFLDSSEVNSYIDTWNNSTVPIGCQLRCQAFTPSKEICKDETYLETINPALTIIVYIVVRLINGLTLATSFTLFEGAVVAIMKENDGNLGLQRMYGNLGQIVMTPISGLLIDYYSRVNHKEDYKPAFFLYCGIKFLCAILMLLIDLEFKEPSKKVIKDFKELIIQPRVFSFILFIVVVGTSFGFVETFLFWLLEDLGADKSLMGITVTVGAAFGIPLLMVSSIFIEKLGHVNTLTICSFVYVIRFIGYSLINNPWMAMPFEALESFTNSLMTVTAISYAGILAKDSTVASMQGLMAGTYHGVGRGFGSLAGGVMIKRLGNRITFQVLGATCGTAGVIYFLVNKLFLSKKKVDTTENIKPQTQNTVSVETPVLKDQKSAGESNLNYQTMNDQNSSNDKTKTSNNGLDNQAFNDTP